MSTQTINYDKLENDKTSILNNINALLTIFNEVNELFTQIQKNEMWTGKRADLFFETFQAFVNKGVDGNPIISKLENEKTKIDEFMTQTIGLTQLSDELAARGMTFEDIPEYVASQFTLVNNAMHLVDDKTEDAIVAGLTGSNLEPVFTVDVPEGYGKVHTYMGWQKVTSQTSNQYKFRSKVGQKFDDEGFGRVGDRYVIACTTTYGKVGDYVDFYQEDGTVIHGVIGDIKSQGDAGCTKWGHNNGHCIVEFVVNKDTWYRNGEGDHVNPGNASCHPEWNQNIDKVVNLGSYYDNPDGIYVS